MALFDDLFSTPVEAGTGNTAASGLEGLLGNPLFTGGIGLLAGALDKSTSTGQDILGGLQSAQQGVTFGQQRAAQQLQNEAAREQLRQASRQRRAQQEFFEQLSTQPNAGLLGAGTGAGLLTPAEAQQRRSGLLDFQDPETLELFATAFPGELGGLIADSFGQTTEPTIPVAGGRLPVTDLPPDTLEAVVSESLARGGAIDFDDPESVRALTDRIDTIRGRERVMETIALQQAAMDAQKTKFEAQQEQFESENMELKRGKILKESLNNALDVSRSLRSLIDTAAEPGGFEFSRDIISTIAKAEDLTPQFVQDLTGVNITEAKRLAGLMETFVRESKGKLVLNLKELSELGINPTDRKTSELAKITPSMENQPADNVRNVIKIIRGLRDSVEATPGETFGDDAVERELQKELELLEDSLGVGGTAGTVSEPTTRTPILQLPGGSSLSNTRSE